ncbi:hypothetical protein HKBW3S43_00639 [Candidatus Hakubella thermalkaliphila]|uniref:Uncharacterized protein n=1 Tax=Candidatus Hakubella thermalkaliphila TaxID=2754717 RepID=A0A6V8Q4C2_9ACTN|nr:hypothetical protein HKBW3S43_00639 [Candidatus Hakubella thermalkaliphila]GFP39280.1 hypothetical protein HKBW3S47_00979 [Candidatus Hakubella thermalkaliphila]
MRILLLSLENSGIKSRYGLDERAREEIWY